MNVQIAHFYKYPSVGNELCAHTQYTHFLGRLDDFRMWAHAFCAYDHCSQHIRRMHRGAPRCPHSIPVHPTGAQNKSLISNTSRLSIFTH